MKEYRAKELLMGHWLANAKTDAVSETNTWNDLAEETTRTFYKKTGFPIVPEYLDRVLVSDKPKHLTDRQRKQNKKKRKAQKAARKHNH